MHTMEEEQILRKVEWRLWVELPQMNLDIPAQEVAIRRAILLDYVEENIKELLEAAAIPVVQRNRYTVVHKGFLLLLFSLFGFNGSRELIGLGNAINDDLHFWVYGARGNGRWNKYRTAFYDFIRKLKERKDVFRVQKGVPDSQHASGMYKTYYSYVLDCYLQSVNKDHVVYYYDRVYSFKRGYWQAGSMRTGPKRLSDPYVVPCDDTEQPADHQHDQHDAEALPALLTLPDPCLQTAASNHNCFLQSNSVSPLQLPGSKSYGEDNRQRECPFGPLMREEGVLEDGREDCDWMERIAPVEEKVVTVSDPMAMEDLVESVDAFSASQSVADTADSLALSESPFIPMGDYCW